MSPAARKSKDWTPSFLKHRHLMAAEAVLVVGLLKGVLDDQVKAADLPNWGKVVFLMAGTVGLLGGLYWVIEGLTARGIERAHGLMRAFSLHYFGVHGLVLLVLFFVYAWRHDIPVF